MKVLIVLVAAIACALAADESLVTRYYGYQVIRTFPQTMNQYDALHQLEEQGHLDFWTEIRKGNPTDIMVAPHQMKAFTAHLVRHGIEYQTQIPNVETLIEAERHSQSLARQDEMNWTSYPRLAVVHAWLRELAAAFPDLVTLEILGQSYKGQDLPLVKVSTGGSGKAAVWIDGNIHAREWISPAVTTYILNELVTKSESYADLLAKYDFYIVPNVNPDGNEWTHTNARLWRKTRTDYGSALGCLGVDANRNWGYLFGQPGASNDKCSDTYRGPSAFSEPENLLLQQYIENTSANWLLFVTFHSYGQYALLPYGDGSRPDDYDELLVKANIFADALQAVDGTQYSVGNSEDVLYTTSGTSHDWAKGSGFFKYAYTFELRDTGNYGFELPANQIIPTAEETWTGLQAMIRAI